MNKLHVKYNRVKVCWAALTELQLISVMLNRKKKREKESPNF